jgi:hypothetical protein
MKLLPTLGSAAILAMVITFAIGRSPPAPSPRPPHLKAEPVVILKSAKEDLYSPQDDAKVVRIIPITRATEGIPHVIKAPALAKAPAEPELTTVYEPEPEIRPRRQRRERIRRDRTQRYSGGDICARHNMRKVTTGRSWRCRH